MKPRLLFVCVENAGRSQIAEAVAKSMGYEAKSAGTMPARRVNETVVEVMKEIGMDIGKNSPQLLTDDMINWADITVTMGCSVEDVCPAPLLAKMHKKLIEWNIADPAGKPIDEVRAIRDEIKRKLENMKLQ
ncbi:MAG: arsenate reductase ArsC [Nitrososphaerota archaeon]|jgi:protein-tyrosine-phosphatase|nr:arsenate reductase ArsC [Nitrososphaerota archaeon]MDG7039385.1 arsenate reductase ArsC [Nitrososphaerota archaeon]MDG7043255.1 arsenate reductase ArsC [Nitrososphaerota archaeon]